jgi:hypothetical protein
LLSLNQQALVIPKEASPVPTLRGPSDETFDDPSTLRASIYAVAGVYYCPEFVFLDLGRFERIETPARIKGPQTPS